MTPNIRRFWTIASVLSVLPYGIGALVALLDQRAGEHLQGLETLIVLMFSTILSMLFVLIQMFVSMARKDDMHLHWLLLLLLQFLAQPAMCLGVGSLYRLL